MRSERHFYILEDLIVHARKEAARKYLRRHKSDLRDLSEREVRVVVYRLIVLALKRTHLVLVNSLFRLVPMSMKNEDSQFKSMWAQYKGLQAAREGLCFFPSSVPPDRWWDGPHLFPNKKDGKPLSDWHSGRVEYVDEVEEDIRVHIASEPPSSQPHKNPPNGHVSVSFEMFNEWCVGDVSAHELEPGRFIEVVVYGDQSSDDPFIRVHPQVEVEWDLPAEAFDRNRYLKRDGWVKE